MKSILMKMDLKVYEQLQNSAILAKDEKDCPVEGCGYTFHEWIDKNTVLAWVQSDDKVVDTLLVDPAKELDKAGELVKPIITTATDKDGKITAVETARVVPELVKKLEGWPVEEEPKEDELVKEVVK